MINEKPQYITIQKAAKAYGVSSQVLRNWDRDGFVTAIRSPNNIRMFSIKDLENALNINRNDDKKNDIFIVESAKPLLLPGRSVSEA